VKKLIIIGAGGYGREVSTMARQSLGYGQDFIVKGFLDSKVDALKSYNAYPPILGDIGDYVIQPDDVFVCAIEDVVRRRHCYDVIIERGGQPYTLIHQSCRVADGAEIGLGCVLSYDIIVSNDTQIGDQVLINSRAIIGHDSRVANGCSIGVQAFLAGAVKLGAGVTIHASASIHKGLTIGSGASVGMSSTVVRDVPANVTVFGTPAKVIFTKA
jgi:sugar O-acyltransferase (sialic acid O-acetyltransferase NeuD family)